MWVVIDRSRLEELGRLIQGKRKQFKAPTYSLAYTGMLIASMALIGVLVYVTGGVKTAAPHLFYIPIVITGITKGSAWGGATGLVSGLFTGPFMPLDVAGRVMQDPSNWCFRLCFFVFIGYVSGVGSSMLIVKNQQLSKKNKELNATLKALTSAFARAIDAKDTYTANHSEKVARYAVRLGKRSGLSREQLQCLFQAGILHDIGKIAIPDRVLNKPGSLTPDEFDLIREHPLHGYDILKPIRGLQDCAKLVLYHHKGLNGWGYPDGLQDETVPIEARILAIADAWDAMTSDRPYRSALSKDEALMRLKEGSGTQFDPELVSKVTELIGD